MHENNFIVNIKKASECSHSKNFNL